MDAREFLKSKRVSLTDEIGFGETVAWMEAYADHCNMKTKEVKAKDVWMAYMVYAGYIDLNNLPDDTAQISAKDVISFVRDHIEDDEIERYFEWAKGLD